MFPIEIFERIASFVDRETAEQMALCSRELYLLLQNRLWNYPKFRTRSTDMMENLIKFPIKILGPEIGFVQVELLKKMAKLELYNLPDERVTAQMLIEYMNTGVKIGVNSLSLFKKVKPWFLDPKAMQEDLEVLANLLRLSLANLTFYHIHDYCLWNVKDITLFWGINIPLFSFRCICFHRLHIKTLPGVLEKLTIHEIYMDKPGCGFTAQIPEKDLWRYFDLPITRLSSVFLMEKRVSWTKIMQMKKLSILYLREGNWFVYPEEHDIKGLCLGKCKTHHSNDWKDQWSTFRYYDIIIIDTGERCSDVDSICYVTTEDITFHF